MSDIKVLAQNRKARHEYFIEETLEAGIELFGTEVKSIRAGKLNITDSYVVVDNGQALVNSMHISPYERGNIYNRDPLRPRRLLLHKAQIIKLKAHVMLKGYSLIPLKVYLTHGLVKLEVAVCKGKKLYDKRHDIKDRDANREMDRHMKQSRRGDD